MPSDVDNPSDHTQKNKPVDNSVARGGLWTVWAAFRAAHGQNCRVFVHEVNATIAADQVMRTLETWDGDYVFDGKGVHRVDPEGGLVPVFHLDES